MEHQKNADAAKAKFEKDREFFESGKKSFKTLTKSKSEMQEKLNKACIRAIFCPLLGPWTAIGLSRKEGHQRGHVLPGAQSLLSIIHVSSSAPLSPTQAGEKAEQTAMEAAKARNQYILMLAAMNAQLAEYYNVDLPKFVDDLDGDYFDRAREYMTRYAWLPASYSWVRRSQMHAKA